MHQLSMAAILEKNKLSSDKPWYLLLDIVLNPDDPSTAVSLARNTDPVLYNGKTYDAYNFDLDVVEEKGNAELPQVQLRASNVGRLLEGSLTKYNGGVGASVTLSVVNEANMAGEPDLTLEFTILSTSTDEEWVTFDLGADSPMRMPFPKNYYYATNCHHVYNSPAVQAGTRGRFCKFAGTDQTSMDLVNFPTATFTTCDKTWNGPNGCQAHKNQPNFGGFPNLDQQAIAGI